MISRTTGAMLLATVSLLVVSAGAAAQADTWYGFKKDTERTGSVDNEVLFSDVPTFMMPNPVPIGVGPVDGTPIIADLWGDERMEVVVANHFNKQTADKFVRVRAYEQNADSTALVPKWTYTVVDPFIDFEPTDGFGLIEVADLNNDGNLEIFLYAGLAEQAEFKPGVVISFSGGLVWGQAYVLNGATGAQMGTAPVTVPDLTPPVVADIDGDGKQEAVFIHANSGSNAPRRLVSVGMNPAVGVEFDTVIEASATHYWSGLAAGEFVSSHQGEELVVVGYQWLASTTQGQVRLYMPSAASAGAATCGSMPCYNQLSINTGPYGVGIADLDGDAQPEIVATGSASNTLQVVEVSPTGVLSLGGQQAQAAAGRLETYPTLGDVTGDGDPDIVLVERHSGAATQAHPGNVRVKSYNPGFAEQGLWARPAAAGATTEALFGGSLVNIWEPATPDGRPEFVFGDFAGNIVFTSFTTVGTQDAVPSQLWTLPLSTGLARSPPAIGDVNNDCRPDVLFGTTDGRLLVVGDLTNPPVPPTEPTGVTATANALAPPLEIKLLWGAPVDNGGAPVLGYKIYRSTTQGFTPAPENLLATVAGNVYEYTDTSFTAGQDDGKYWYYRILAYNCPGDGALAPELEEWLPDITKPAKILNLAAAQNGVNKIDTSWSAATDNVGVTGYEIRFSVAPDNDPKDNTPDIQIAPATSYTHSGLPATTLHYYVIRAVDAAGNKGDWSNVASATTGNTKPVATSMTVDANPGAQSAFALAGTDADGHPLTFEVLTQPSLGSLSGTAPSLVYTPPEGSCAQSTFTFRVNDGYIDSDAATVTLKNCAGNSPPTADPVSVWTPKQQLVSFVLSGADAEGNSLTYQFVTQPTLGSITGNLPQVDYQPAFGKCGTDTFSYRAHDGAVFGPPASITVEVSCLGNQPPKGNAQVSVTQMGTTFQFSLTALDPEGDPITAFEWVTTPQNGKITGSWPLFTYTPNPGFFGIETLLFRVADSNSFGDTAEVVIVVKGLEAPPGSTGDSDQDGVKDVADNCAGVANPSQSDADADNSGDACDASHASASSAKGSTATSNQASPTVEWEHAGDRDLDGVQDVADNCPSMHNPDQADLDADGFGDVCDVDRDGDGIQDGLDNCRVTPNSSQADADLDGQGDACDTVLDEVASTAPISDTRARPADPVSAQASSTGKNIAWAVGGGMFILALGAVGILLLYRRL